MGEKHIPENAEQSKAKDHVSDPKLSDDTGHDWTDEGGATEDGAAISGDDG
ncbi:hypothetical protein OK351_09540 [Glutamicibacter sp. MNS18]|uniref:hypothetical protein n=1 Tax=Glutamicibacter sp. MNS18 TaxID=2989817 RepID=UPI0022357348|nr:hypothetical protein [Glutamicibacter sp. MNS18]MCW4465749.1 hypothetical protein [Glutamicibacter sp. MNS18]